MGGLGQFAGQGVQIGRPGDLDGPCEQPLELGLAVGPQRQGAQPHHPGDGAGEDACFAVLHGARVGAVTLAATRYGALTTSQLADLVEFAYTDGETCEWELIFELTRRALANDPGGHPGLDGRGPNSHS